MKCQWFCSDFGQPVYWSSGLCSCVAGGCAWYVLPWNLLALVWCLVSVSSVSLLLSCIQGYCYHLSKFHIYALVYCIVYRCFSFWLTSLCIMGSSFIHLIRVADSCWYMAKPIQYCKESSFHHSVDRLSR